MSASPTPTPSPAPVHTIAFGGDCANVLPTGDVEQALGGPVTLNPYRSGALPGIGTLGGIRCFWTLDDSDDARTAGLTQLEVNALPRSVVSPESVAEVATAACAPWYDSSVCRRGQAFGDTFLLVSSSWLPTEPDVPMLESILTAVSARSEAFPSPVPAPAEPDRWTPTTCEELGSRMHLDELLGSGYITGWWEGDPSAQLENRLTASASVEQMCEWFADPENDATTDATIRSIAATVWPGGAVNAVPAIAAGETVTVTGADSAAISLQGLTAVSGSNAARIFSRPKDTGDVMARLLAAMNG